jgi:hypothetical protein
MAMTDPIGGCPATVVVSRNGIDQEGFEALAVQLEDVDRPRWTDYRGGDHRPLSRWTIAVYLEPAKWPFARSGRHSPRPGGQRLTLLVEPEVNDPAVYSALREQAAGFVPNRRNMRQRRRRRGESPARAVLAYIDGLSADTEEEHKR